MEGAYVTITPPTFVGLLRCLPSSLQLYIPVILVRLWCALLPLNPPSSFRSAFNWPLTFHFLLNARLLAMSVMLETSLGDLIIDLEVDRCPRTCENFLKLCKVKYYALNAFFNGEQDCVM